MKQLVTAQLQLQTGVWASQCTATEMNHGRWLDLTVPTIKSSPLFTTNVNKDDELALVVINLKFYCWNLKMFHCLFFSRKLLLLLVFTDT